MSPVCLGVGGEGWVFLKCNQFASIYQIIFLLETPFDRILTEVLGLGVFILLWCFVDFFFLIQTDIHIFALSNVSFSLKLYIYINIWYLT